MSGHTALIAICLPTRNRSETLARSLVNLIEKVRPFNIPIHISDNSTDDKTAVIVKSLQLDYSFLYYSKCEKELIADANFERALHLSEAKYRWLFGDHYKIQADFNLEALLKLLEKDYDLIALNSNHRIKFLKSGEYADCVFLLKELGWHVTMLAALIYSDRLLARIDFKRYYGTFLTQTLSMFDEFSRNGLRFFWLADNAIDGYMIDPRDSWHPRALSVFVENWFHGVMSLPPAYGNTAKQIAIMSHASNVELFSLRGMVYLRSLGAISFSKVWAVRKEVFFAFRGDRQLFLCCGLMVPRFIAEIILKIHSRFRK